MFLNIWKYNLRHDLFSNCWALSDNFWLLYFAALWNSTTVIILRCFFLLCRMFSLLLAHARHQLSGMTFDKKVFTYFQWFHLSTNCQGTGKIGRLPHKTSFVKTECVDTIFHIYWIFSLFFSCRPCRSSHQYCCCSSW